MSHHVRLLAVLGAIALMCVSMPRAASAQTPATPPVAVTPDASATAPSAARQAGRRAMHNGLDPEAAKIAVKPVVTTIATASTFTRPKVLSGNARVEPFETTIWSVNAQLVSIAPEDDGDLFLVLQDENGKRMTAELPDPALVKESPWYKNIVAARKAGAEVVSGQQKTPAVAHSKPLRVRVTGAGYFGKISSGEDEPSGLLNGFQLHPVTGFMLFP